MHFKKDLKKSNKSIFVEQVNFPKNSFHADRELNIDYIKELQTQIKVI